MQIFKAWSHLTPIIAPLLFSLPFQADLVVLLLLLNLFPSFFHLF
jgi:hypothetical protein